jgi:cytochrome c-type biogenesis protein CcmH
MRRLALPLAAGVLLALAGLALVALLRPSVASDAATLAAELRCPDCEGLSVGESPTRSAAEIRRQIDALLADGATADQVRQHFVDRYGEWILLSPRSPLPWLAPIALLALGVAGFWLWLRRAPTAPAPPAPAASGDAASRVADEAEALDA